MLMCQIDNIIFRPCNHTRIQYSLHRSILNPISGHPPHFASRELTNRPAEEYQGGRKECKRRAPQKKRENPHQRDRLATNPTVKGFLWTWGVLRGGKDSLSCEIVIPRNRRDSSRNCGNDGGAYARICECFGLLSLQNLGGLSRKLYCHSQNK